MKFLLNIYIDIFYTAEYFQNFWTLFKLFINILNLNYFSFFIRWFKKLGNLIHGYP